MEMIEQLFAKNYDWIDQLRYKKIGSGYYLRIINIIYDQYLQSLYTTNIYNHYVFTIE